jgi:acyl-lipid omega-6 desaturase (Delta-12 desaturase)
MTKGTKENTMETKQITALLKQFAKSDSKKVWMQLINTILPYFALMIAAMHLGSKGVSYFLTLPISLLSSFFMMRIFIFFHDCTHKSFVKTAKWNAILGNFFGVLVFTPYLEWQTSHNTHHATVGNLDKRGIGDIWTLTVEEYRKASFIKRILYGMFRNPIFLFLISPVFLFTILNRFPKYSATKREILNTLYTNLGMVLVGALFSVWFSLKVYLIYQITIVGFSATIGVWLFYIQHQFEEVYWEEGTSWGVLDAALRGSSFYKLPKVLEWFSGYIGYHHIHHLNSKIPNYNLKSSSRSLSELKGIREITLLESFKLASLKFYDENTKRLITKKELKAILKEAS